MNISLRMHYPKALSVAASAVLAFLAAGASAQSDEVLELDIKPQKADSALVTLAKSSGVQIILAEGAGEDVEVEGLKGEYRFDEALAALLTETGLTHEYAAENLIVVQEAEQARAQDPEAAGEAPAEEEEAPLELAEQSVTGTRLRSGPEASPVFVLTRAEIDRRGLTNIEDIARYLPQNFSTIVNGGSYDYASPRFQIGSVTLNLRGLGDTH